MKPSRIILTDRDYALLKLIGSYGILTSKQIGSLVFKCVNLATVLRRLRALEVAGYIEQTVSTTSFDRCWYVTPKTKLELDLNAAKSSYPKAIIEHDLTLTTLRLHLEFLGVARSWIPEHEIRRKVVGSHGLRASKRKVIPDGIMGVARGTNESVAIEVELTVKNQRRYDEIFRDYSMKSNLWGIWYLVPDQTTARQIFKAREDHYGPCLLISEIKDVMKNGGKAVISDEKKAYRVEQVFNLYPVEKPAHPAAQQVSGQGLNARAPEHELSAENVKETLVPTG